MAANFLLHRRKRQTQVLNLKKAFKIVRNDVKLNTIVIIDDIYTTGSTVDAIAQVQTDTDTAKPKEDVVISHIEVSEYDK